jgi:hypothetical protein
MAKIKIECEIEFDEEMWYSHDDEDSFEWFKSVLNDKENTIVLLHSNDVGDSIGETTDFKWKLLNQNKDE